MKNSISRSNPCARCDRRGTTAFRARAPERNGTGLRTRIRPDASHENAIGVLIMMQTVLRNVAACTVAVLLAYPALAASLTVGPGQQYTTIAAAVAASHDGDAITVLAGTYVKNDYAEINTKIMLTAAGGAVNMVSQGYIPNGKGILITDTDVTITGFSFTGAQVTSGNGGNGAGIRYQGGNLVLNNCYFANNQNGLLSNPDPTGTITVNSTEFYHNGVSTGSSAGYTHNIYVGDIAKFDAEKSYFHGANVGHEIKSRAVITIVNNSQSWTVPPALRVTASTCRTAAMPRSPTIRSSRGQPARTPPSSRSARRVAFMAVRR